MSKYLVIQLARFGDLVQTGRLIASLSSDGNEVHILVDASLAELARILYPLAAVHSIIAHGPGVHGDLASVQVFRDNRKIMQHLEQVGFEQVFNLNFSGLNHALSRLFSPETVRGHGCKGRQAAKSRWTDMGFRWARRRAAWGINLVDYWAHLADRPIAPELVNPAAEAGGGGLGIVLAGRNSRRSLPPKVLASVSAALWNASGKGDILFLGSAGEHEASRELVVLLQPPMRERLTNLAGKTDWKALVEIVSALDMVLTPDTGVMHLAARLGTPVQAFFLSSAWCHETGPYGAGHTVWQAVRNCAPCLESQACPHSLACLDPFASREFLRALANRRYDREISGVLGLRSGFDLMGATYSSFCGDDPLAEERAVFREFCAAHLGLIPEEGSLTRKGQGLAETMYLERDWMTEPFIGPLPQEGVHG